MTTDAPCVSVIVAVYNDAARLPRAIASIAVQTLTDWELIIVDDGSIDATRSVAEDLAAANPRIRTIFIAHTGPGAARNAAIAEARGEWIAILDSDDYAAPERLERQLAFAQAHPTAGLVATQAWRIASNGRAWGTWAPGPDTIEAFRAKRDSGSLIYFVHSSVMVRRSLMLAVGGYPEDYPTGEDTALYNLRLASQTDMVTLPEPLVSHEMNPDSTSRRLLRGMVTDIEVVKLNRQRQLDGLPILGWRDFVETITVSLSTTQCLLACRRVFSLAWQLKGTAQLAGGHLSGVVRVAATWLLAPELAIHNVWRIVRSARH